MKRSLITGLAILATTLVFSGCGAGSSKNMVAKVYETSYPDGISVSIYDGKIKDSVSVSDARMAFARNKSQVQFILKNNSKNVHNVLVNTEWTDKRGIVIPTYPRPQKVRLQAQNGKRIVVDAPNFKAKNVLINIECGNNCTEEK